MCECEQINLITNTQKKRIELFLGSLLRSILAFQDLRFTIVATGKVSIRLRPVSGSLGISMFAVWFSLFHSSHKELIYRARVHKQKPNTCFCNVEVYICSPCPAFCTSLQIIVLTCRAIYDFLLQLNLLSPFVLLASLCILSSFSCRFVPPACGSAWDQDRQEEGWGVQACGFACGSFNYSTLSCLLSFCSCFSFFPCRFLYYPEGLRGTRTIKKSAGGSQGRFYAVIR